MKRIYKIFALLMLVSVMISCSKESENLSRLTNYVVIDLDGASTVAVAKGENYVEPGYTALEGENDVTGDVKIESNIDNTKLGVYKVNYSSVNKDGFSSSTSRTVVVYDPAAPDTDLSGKYSTAIVRTESDGSKPRKYSGEINITKVGKGVFYVDCLLGATYSVHYGYGPAYAMTGYVSLNADNTFSLITSFVKGWGDSLEGFQNGKYDPATGGVYWESIFASADIYAVTATK